MVLRSDAYLSSSTHKMLVFVKSLTPSGPSVPRSITVGAPARLTGYHPATIRRALAPRGDLEGYCAACRTWENSHSSATAASLAPRSHTSSEGQPPSPRPGTTRTRGRPQARTRTRGNARRRPDHPPQHRPGARPPMTTPRKRRKPPGATTRGGRGNTHQRRRAAIAPLINAGHAPRARCLQTIDADEEWHLDHYDDRDGYPESATPPATSRRRRSHQRPRSTNALPGAALQVVTTLV